MKDFLLVRNFISNSLKYSDGLKDTSVIMPL